MNLPFVRSILAIMIPLSVLPVRAQYTDPAAVNDLGGPQEFTLRRTELGKQLKTGYLILFARKTLPEAVHYREDNDFFYYTGISDPGAVLVMDIAKGKTLLFDPEQSPAASKSTARMFSPCRRSNAKSLASKPFSRSLSSIVPSRELSAEKPTYGCGLLSPTKPTEPGPKPAETTAKSIPSLRRSHARRSRRHPQASRTLPRRPPA